MTLPSNILTNSDKAVLSAKQLGADKRVSMWTADSQVGMVILRPPPIPQIDHEGPWIESRATREMRERSALKLMGEQDRPPGGEARNTSRKKLPLDREAAADLTCLSHPRPQAGREDEDMSDRQARRGRH